LVTVADTKNQRDFWYRSLKFKWADTNIMFFGGGPLKATDTNIKKSVRVLKILGGARSCVRFEVRTRKNYKDEFFTVPRP
jgi:hypothetical protein